MTDKIYPLLLIMAVSCLPNCGLWDRNPDYVLGSSLDVYYEGDIPYAPSDVETVLRTTSRELDPILEVHEDVLNDFAFESGQVQLWMHDEPFVCRWPDKVVSCGGYTKVDLTGYRMKVYANDRDCIANTALAHEFIHAVSIRFNNEWDYNHQNEALWGTGGAEVTILKSVFFELCN